MGYRLLVVEDDATPAESSVHRALALDGSFVRQSLRWTGLTPETLAGQNAHAIVAVAVPSTPQATQVFEWLRGNPIRTPTLVVLPPQPSDPVIELATSVSDDVLFSPLRISELQHRLRRVVRHSNDDLADIRERLLEELGMTQLVGRDPTFLQVVAQIPRFARSEAPVLITGETGTGKELCARAIHFLSKRRDFPFIAVDCGALPDHLIENELFGHARGAYTDAHRDQRGLIAMAEGGTLFLDEIDSLSLTAQAKLLRFLQDRTFRPLGSERFMRADVTVIAATNRDLEGCTRDKQFRADLFYRLNVLRLHLPPLRERRGDIGALVARFLDERVAAGCVPRTFSLPALRLLAAHDWPGNVRELQNTVERAIVACDTPLIQPQHIELPRTLEPDDGARSPFRSARAAAVAQFERRYVVDLLRTCGGNVTRAARQAGKERRALGRLIKRYGIDRTAL